MKFDAFGNRIVVKPAKPADNRKAAFWYEQEKVDDYGFCDKPIQCVDGLDVTHLCGRFKGHDGRCAALVKVESGGRTIRRLEYG